MVFGADWDDPDLLEMAAADGRAFSLEELRMTASPPADDDIAADINRALLQMSEAAAVPDFVIVNGVELVRGKDGKLRPVEAGEP
jgi:hypothetical protein